MVIETASDPSGARPARRPPGLTAHHHPGGCLVGGAWIVVTACPPSRTWIGGSVRRTDTVLDTDVGSSSGLDAVAAKLASDAEGVEQLESRTSRSGSLALRDDSPS